MVKRGQCGGSMAWVAGAEFSSLPLWHSHGCHVSRFQPRGSSVKTTTLVKLRLYREGHGRLLFVR